jgi:G3E family GTPase
MQVNLLFGFLGSGKTTLAKHLLAERGVAMKTAVIVNEFGEVGVDGDILRGKNIDVVELNSGCLCCTLRGSLMLAIEELRDKAKVERIIVEATGVAQPSELLDTLADFSRDGRLVIGPLVTVVDIAKFSKLTDMLGDFYSDQIESADVVIANKIDLASAEQLEEAVRQIRDLNPEARILFATQCEVAPDQILEQRASELVEEAREELLAEERVGGPSAGSLSPAKAEPSVHGGAHEHHHDHGADHAHHHHDHGGHHDPHEAAAAESFVLSSSGTARRDGLTRFFGNLPPDVWRAKGFIHVDGSPSLVQYSLGQLEITPAAGAPSEAIVFIGRAMDRPAIESRFALASRA